MQKDKRFNLKQYIVKLIFREVCGWKEEEEDQFL